MAETLAELRGLHKSYRQGRSTVPVIDGLDLSLSRGQFTVILGPSGSGKSTLLNLIGLMDRPDRGEVLIEGRAAGSLSELERASMRNRKFGFVFQFDSLLPEFTLLENVLMPARIRGDKPAEAGTRGRGLLQAFGLSALERRFPNQVSGGERQRAAICRALINSPELILADEPTGNLDKGNGELVFKDLRSLARNHQTAVLMVTHNESSREYADRVLVMGEGTLRET